ncbi:Zinc finger CCCH domain-containing protein 33 [Ananas comosus]|uniref:Zinc finger CCCH domain-containing protein 33 n=1 Tax=Ananas comosus TaxID=4615 RepID=A0A199W2D9_ANACO|nr:Zinc finger CCCH domain-containing protein 33 [Ananas comosus]
MLPNIKNRIYSTDEFRMYAFKVKPCSRAYSHDWTECPFVHPSENAWCRDPRKFLYSCVPCPEFRKGSCRHGDACEYAHGVFESWLHPAQYRTRLCKDETGCARRVCFFAHKPDELRAVNPSHASVSAGLALPSPRSSNDAAAAAALILFQQQQQTLPPPSSGRGWHAPADLELGRPRPPPRLRSTSTPVGHRVHRPVRAAAPPELRGRAQLGGTVAAAELRRRPRRRRLIEGGAALGLGVGGVGGLGVREAMMMMMMERRRRILGLLRPVGRLLLLLLALWQLGKRRGRWLLRLGLGLGLGKLAAALVGLGRVRGGEGEERRRRRRRRSEGVGGGEGAEAVLEDGREGGVAGVDDLAGVVD